MPTSTTLPNGQILTSSALQVAEIEIVLQRLTAQALGLYVDDTATDWSKVRLQWQTDGQPDWKRSDDVAFVQVEVEDQPVFHSRDAIQAQQLTPGGSTATESTHYTNTWRARWTFYGPNALRNARATASVIRMQYGLDVLAQANLYPNLDFAAPTRMHDDFQAQWYERSDFAVSLNEVVLDTVEVQTVSGVTVIVIEQGSVQAGYGVAGYGAGEYGAARQISNTTIQIEVDA